MWSVSGRFDEAVIEERRKATEAMLQFSTTIPALYNSPQLKEFFRVRNPHRSIKTFFFTFFTIRLVLSFSSQGGDVIRPLDPTLSADGALPPPLIPLPKRRASDCEPIEEEEGKEAPTLPQDLGVSVGLDLGEPEVAVEAYREMGGSPAQESEQDVSDEELDDTGAAQGRGCFPLLYLPFPSFCKRLANVSTPSCVSSPTPCQRPPATAVPGRV